METAARPFRRTRLVLYGSMPRGETGLPTKIAHEGGIEELRSWNRAPPARRVGLFVRKNRRFLEQGGPWPTIRVA